MSQGKKPESVTLHPLLQRLLKRHQSNTVDIPSAGNWPRLLEQLSLSFRQMDEDRLLLEHTLEQMSLEMNEINQNLRQELSERYQAELQLRKSRANLARAQEIAKLGSFEYDLNNGTLQLSEESRQILGPLSHFHTPAAALVLLHEDDRECLLAAIHQTREHGIPLNIDCRLRMPNGKLLHLNCQAERLSDHNNEPLKVFGTLHDISDRKQVEAQLAEAKQRLEKGLAEVEQRNREMRLLSELSSLLQNCSHDQEARLAIGQYLEQLFPNYQGMLYLDPQNEGQFSNTLSWGKCPAKSLDTLTASSCLALSNRQTHHVTHPDTEDHCQHMLTPPGGIPPYLCVPLQTRHGLLGLLHLQASDNTSDTLDTVKNLAIAFAEQTALALANLHLRAHLHHQSTHDALTGLFNRRHLEAMLEQALQNSQHHHHPFTLALIDIDHFKQLNDRFGHDAGDSALRTLANTLKTAIQQHGTAYRLGGEEFILLLPGIDEHCALPHCMTLLNTVRDTRFEHASTPLGQITISLGLASYPKHGRSMGTLLKAADISLYQAKQNGRDCIVVSGG